MDPLTQGTLGAALPQATAGRARMGLATLAGFAGGMAPDLDVLIRSSEDPLLFLEYHRQFTHSLVFIPVGAAVVAALLWAGWGWRRRLAAAAGLRILPAWLRDPRAPRWLHDLRHPAAVALFRPALRLEHRIHHRSAAEPCPC
jgi:hypothetical protein